MTTIGERVVSLRTERGLSQAQLATEMGLCQSAISHVETNRRLPSFPLVMKLAKFFSTTLEELIGRDAASFRVKKDKEVYPEQYAAHIAVNNAIAHGKLPKAKTHKCAGCNEQAEQWHHPSYHPDHHLSVVPLCRACHKKVHSGKLAIEHSPAHIDA